MGWANTPPSERFGWFLAALLVGVVIGGPVLRLFSVGVLVLPLLTAGTLSWFVFHVFLRKYIRARRIANARERRLWREAQKR